MMRVLRRLLNHPDKDPRLADLPIGSVGKGTYGGLRVRRFSVNGNLKIGRYCSFAAETEILLGGNHRHDWVTTYPFPAMKHQFAHYSDYAATRGDVLIGNDVWVGRGAMILSGVTIGDGAVIGARAVVARDVQPYSIVAGNPAQHRRYRFDERTINRLLDVAWWEWEEERIARAMPLMLSDNIEAFLAAIEMGAV